MFVCVFVRVCMFVCLFVYVCLSVCLFVGFVAWNYRKVDSAYFKCCLLVPAELTQTCYPGFPELGGAGLGPGGPGRAGAGRKESARGLPHMLPGAMCRKVFAGAPQYRSIASGCRRQGGSSYCFRGTFCFGDLCSVPRRICCLSSVSCLCFPASLLGLSVCGGAGNCAVL